jgi:hypothetical protein
MACPVSHSFRPAMGAAPRRTRLVRLTESATRWMGKVHIPTASRFGGAGEETHLRGLLSPGMVLLSRTRFRPGNLLVPGYWKHAAIYSSDSGARGLGCVVEATVERGVVETPLADFMRDKQDVAILQPTIPRTALRNLASEATKRIGAPYDFGFVDSDNGRYYCSKLVFDCLRAVMGRVPFPLRCLWGRRVVTANDLYEQRHCFDIVYEACGPRSAIGTETVAANRKWPVRHDRGGPREHGLAARQAPAL